MTKTYAQLQKQIAKLQQEADAVRAKEVAGVIGRIQEAIEHYGLTAADLFASPPARKARDTKVAKAVKPARAATGKKQPAPAKYTDGQGKTWNGIGKRPGWFVAALAAGKTAKDLEIGAQQA
jgi:DNA-binding protein H-NS